MQVKWIKVCWFYSRKEQRFFLKKEAKTSIHFSFTHRVGFMESVY